MPNVINSDGRQRWTGTYLEQQLNAWFWGNDYERIAMFRLRQNVDYWIGPVGQDTLADSPTVDRGTGARIPQQRHLAWPGVKSELLQVVLPLRSGMLRSAMMFVEAWDVRGPITGWGRA